MLTSGIVLAGLTIVYLSNLPNADVIATMSVSLLIVYTTLGLGRRTLAVLLNKAPKGIQSQIVESLKGFEGIKNIYSIRIRPVGKDIFIDLQLEVPRTYIHDRAHRIATDVETKIKQDILPNSDVVVHVDAGEDVSVETLKDKILLIAADFSEIKNIHSITFSKIIITNDDEPNSKILTNDKLSQDHNHVSLHLYLDIQVENSLNLGTAHGIVVDFESKIREKIPIIKQITTHIEVELNSEKIIGSEQSVDQELLENIKKIAFSVAGVVDCKNISASHIGNDIQIAFTIKFETSFNRVQLIILYQAKYLIFLIKTVRWI